MKVFLIISASSFMWFSCTKKTVSFETLEDARRQARENAEFNAQDYRSKNPENSSCAIGSAGDSTQKPDCPQGDGWASLVLKCAAIGKEIKLKCSTVSNAVGCVLSDEFKSKPYAVEEGRCNHELPHPLPKIAK